MRLNLHKLSLINDNKMVDFSNMTETNELSKTANGHPSLRKAFFSNHFTTFPHGDCSGWSRKRQLISVYKATLSCLANQNTSDIKFASESGKLRKSVSYFSRCCFRQCNRLKCLTSIDTVQTNLVESVWLPFCAAFLKSLVQLYQL